MKAYLKHYRQSPRKVRLVANMIRGKEVEKARSILSFADQKSAEPMKKLLESAVSNARNQGQKTDNLIVKSVMVDLGLTYHRYMPRSRGRATPLRKRTSRIALELGEKVEKVKPAKKGAPATSAVKKGAKKTEKREVAEATK